MGNIHYEAHQGRDVMLLAVPLNSIASPGYPQPPAFSQATPPNGSSGFLEGITDNSWVYVLIRLTKGLKHTAFPHGGADEQTNFSVRSRGSVVAINGILSIMRSSGTVRYYYP
ncbi:hypothetical protein TgHK011_004256 [Trichoderma gracile]|nr:hypothetical protein TgHK011_004256 [Trichoderma gracile]